MSAQSDLVHVGHCNQLTHPMDAPYVEWGRGFLADRATRPIAPGLKLTAAEAAKLPVGAEP